MAASEAEAETAEVVAEEVALEAAEAEVDSKWDPLRVSSLSLK